MQRYAFRSFGKCAAIIKSVYQEAGASPKNDFLWYAFMQEND